VGERFVTDEQLEELVTQRLKDRQGIIDEVVTALKPELEGMRREISSANHVKRTLGRQLTGLTVLVKQSNAEMRTHAALPFHPQGADIVGDLSEESSKGLELIEQFGIAELSLEQKQALPEVLEEHVRMKQERRQVDRRERRKQAWLLVASQFVGAIAGALVAAASIVAYLHATTPQGVRP